MKDHTEREKMSAPQVSWQVEITTERPEPGELMRRYKVMVYRYIVGGVCGPVSESLVVTGMDGVVSILEDWGFKMTDFPEPNQWNPRLAVAPLKLLEA